MSISTFKKYYFKTLEQESPDILSRIIRTVLFFASKIYECILNVRVFFYKAGIKKSTRLPVPVISVGNITMGGTGKTPVVEYISRYLRKKGKRVAIISRGYASHIKQGEGRQESNVCNDEYLLFRENIPDVPNVLNKDRVKSGKEAIARFQAECLVLDDGFQHLRLIRDLDIVLIDALNPFGYGYTLPRGLLREPLQVVSRAGLIIITHVDQCDYESIALLRDRLERISGNAPVIETTHTPVCIETKNSEPPKEILCLNGKKVYAFCAIGNPLSFKKTVEGTGAELVGFYDFADHHIYKTSDFLKILEEAKHRAAEVILTTQKDRVKIDKDADIWKFPLWTLKMEISIIKGREIFENAINKIIG